MPRGENEFLYMIVNTVLIEFYQKRSDKEYLRKLSEVASRDPGNWLSGRNKLLMFCQ
mgnify:CR=1 FL=1